MSSYIERDVSDLVSPANLNTFQQFLQICDSNQLEVDLLKDAATNIELTEIKAGRAFNGKMLLNMDKIASLIDRPTSKKLIYGGDQNFETQETKVTAWFDV